MVKARGFAGKPICEQNAAECVKEYNHNRTLQWNGRYKVVSGTL